jgi:5-methylcytosine-specific restriction endonuclease McrA
LASAQGRAQDGDVARHEQRVYECILGCGGWHLTSREFVTTKRVPVKAQSVKRQREQRQRAKMLRDTFGPNPSCARCGGPADDAHELLSRARGGSIVDPRNIVPVCRACHSWITTHPAEAAAEGWALSRKDSA